MSIEKGFGLLIGVSHGSAGTASSEAAYRRQGVIRVGDAGHG